MVLLATFLWPNTLKQPVKLDLGLLRYQPDLQFKKEGGVVYIFDPIRNKYLVKNDEEVVRQLMLRYLELDTGWPKDLMAVEKMLIVNERRKRFDILCYHRNGEPVLLVECKAPGIRVDFGTFEQISAYNIALRVPFLCVTNGIDSYCAKVDFAERDFEHLPAVPNFAALASE